MKGTDPKVIQLYKYIGESARSCYERGSEHQSDVTQLKPGSHILKHYLDKHENESLETIREKFCMKVIKFHKSAYNRQIHESVTIQMNRNHHLLNSKAEFNHCALPRLGLKMGEKDFKERKKELLEEEIREMSKSRNKLRAPNCYQPKRKRLKLDTDYEAYGKETIEKKEASHKKERF